MGNKTNPNGANDHTHDPREKIMWNFYIEEIAKGNGSNAYDAAIKAGYTETFAKKVTCTEWFKNRKSKLRRDGMLDKAERNLDAVLDLKYQKKGKVTDSDALKAVVDVSKTVAKTLGKDVGYSERTEMTGKAGAPLIQVVGTLAEKYGLIDAGADGDSEGQS